MNGYDNLPYDRLPGSDGCTVMWIRSGYSEFLLKAGVDRPETLALRNRSRQLGRGTVVFFPLEGRSGERAVMKRYRRGGFAGMFLPDRFVGLAPFLRELRTVEEAIGAGIPVPLPLGLVRQGRWGFHRVYGISRSIDSARNLLELMDDPMPASRRRRLARTIARTIRMAQDGGLDHRDLNLGNVLASPAGNGFQVHLVDLAGSRMRRPLPMRRRIRVLKRFRRSWEKQLFLRGRRSGIEVNRFLVEYASGNRELLRVLGARVRWDRLLLAVHRAGWRLMRQ